MSQHAKAGSRGGAAGKGEAKRRDMKKAEIGRQSRGYSQKKVQERQPRPDSFRDVGRACLNWLREHGERHLSFGDY